MNRTDFESKFESLGLRLTSYENAAYYGALQRWSLALTPFASDTVTHARLAINMDEPRERAVIVDAFLAAANVPRAPQIADDIEAGKEFRLKIGPKQVSVTALGSETVVNVIE